MFINQKKRSNSFLFMKKNLFTCFMCFITYSAFTQEISKQENPTVSESKDTIAQKPPGYPIFVDTGNPLEDSKRYDAIKEKYLIDHPITPIAKSIPTVSEADVLQQIKNIDSHLKSIEIKSEYLLKDPALKEQAEKDGWFEDMKATKLKLEQRKAELIQSLEK